MILAERLATPAVRGLAVFAAVALLLMIIYLSLLPPGNTPSPRFADKIRHLMAYLALAIPVAVAAGRGRLLLALGLCIVAGASLEVAQSAMALGRDGSFADGLANTLGASLGTGLVALLVKPKR